MRALSITATLLIACSVPDKHAPADAGTDVSDSDTLETKIDEGPPQFSSMGTATFRFSANVPEATFVCSLDGQPSEACASPFSRALADGTHSFSVRAVSSEGNSDPTPAEHLWSIDTVAPTTTLTEAPPAADNSTTVRFLFTSNEMNVSFECSLDNGAFAPCRSGDTFGPIGDGPHAFAVRARDRADNFDSSPAIHAWLVDTSTPDTQLLSGPDGAQRSQTASFTFTSPDAGAGAAFECALDNAPFSPCSSPAEYTNLSMGAHTFAVRVLDAVGNLDPTPATRNWIVDFTPPETTLLGGPNGIVAMASASFTFTSSEPDVVFECSLDGAAFAPCTSPFDAIALAQGAHTFAVRAIDVAGNEDGTPATASWTVDTLPAALTITSGPATNSTHAPRIIFTFTADEGVIECRLGVEDWVPCAEPVRFQQRERRGRIPAAQHRRGRQRHRDLALLPGGVHRARSGRRARPLAPRRWRSAPRQRDRWRTGNTRPGRSVGRELALRRRAAVHFDRGRRGRVAARRRRDRESDRRAMVAAASGGRHPRFAGDRRRPRRHSDHDRRQPRAVLGIPRRQRGRYIHGEFGRGRGVHWNHVLVSLEDSALRMWVDGDRVERGDARAGTAPSLDSLRIGGGYSGSIDEVYVAPFAIVDEETALQRFCPASGFRL